MFVINSGNCVERCACQSLALKQKGGKGESVHLGLERPLDWKTQILRLHWRQLGQLGIDMFKM